jgi:hypothetical protein
VCRRIVNIGNACARSSAVHGTARAGSRSRAAAGEDGLASRSAGTSDSGGDVASERDAVRELNGAPFPDGTALPTLIHDRAAVLAQAGADLRILARRGGGAVSSAALAEAARTVACALTAWSTLVTDPRTSAGIARAAAAVGADESGGVFELRGRAVDAASAFVAASSTAARSVAKAAALVGTSATAALAASATESRRSTQSGERAAAAAAAGSCTSSEQARV